MLFVAISLLGVVSALASYRLDRRRLYAISKALASLGFIGTALASGALDAGWTRVALGALVLSAAGDVALAVRGKRGFIAGLVCFAAAHGVYTLAFSLLGSAAATLVATAVVVAIASGVAWTVLRRHLPDSLRVPVGVYLVIISAMLATGTAGGITHDQWLLFAGVVLVFASDIAVARERFGTPGFANKLLGLPTYYAGQTLIALSLGGF